MRIAVVGTGLMGASLGLAWRARGYAVFGCDEDPAALQAALDRGAFDGGVAFEEAREHDVMVLATPIDVVCGLVGQLREREPRPRVSLDVASLQGPVVRAAAGLAGFVATHPMAGREGRGAAAADAALFAGHPWIYDPSGGEAQRTVVGLIAETGAVPVAMDAVTHDRAVAVTSHLPQLLAIALAHCAGRHADEPGVREVVGPGLQGALRLASASWNMWRPLLAELADRDASLLEELAGELRSLSAGLRRGGTELEEAFRRAPAEAGRLFRDKT